jgi:hypothetical protein
MDTDPKAAIPYLEKSGDIALNDLAEALSISGQYDKANETLQKQEDILRVKAQAGDEFAKDEILRVTMNMVHNLKAQGHDEQALEKLKEIKPYIGDADFLSYIDTFGLKSGSKSPRL